jgi:hypothetical protein
MRQNYAEFLIDFYALQEDSSQQQILLLANKLRHQHGITIEESIRQAVKLRKDCLRRYSLIMTSRLVMIRMIKMMTMKIANQIRKRNIFATFLSKHKMGSVEVYNHK